MASEKRAEGRVWESKGVRRGYMHPSCKGRKRREVEFLAYLRVR